VRIETAILAVIMASAPAWAQNVMPREQTFNRSVRAGQELRVFTYARWHRNCSPLEMPRIVVRTQPAHGTVSLRAGPTTVSFIRAGEPDCTGHTYQGMGVWYLPAPGFTGTDKFDWDVIGSGNASHDTAVVEVR
jgi:hypothetical protein